MSPVNDRAEPEGADLAGADATETGRTRPDSAGADRAGEDVGGHGMAGAGSAGTGSVGTGSAGTGSVGTGSAGTGSVGTGSVGTGSGGAVTVAGEPAVADRAAVGLGSGDSAEAGPVESGSAGARSGGTDATRCDPGRGGSVGTGSVVTGSAGTGSVVTGSVGTGSVGTGSVVTGSAGTGSVGNGPVGTGSAEGGSVVAPRDQVALVGAVGTAVRGLPAARKSSGAHAHAHARRAGRPGVRRSGAGRAGRVRGGWTPWLYLAPALVVLGGLLVYPIYQLGLISFFQYTQAQVSGGEPATFEGFGNYAELFGDPQFWQVLLATVLFAAACVVSTLAVGCALAVLLTRVRAVPRLALMLAALGAWATPAVTGSTVWLFLFDPDFGPVNRMLGLGDHSWTYGRLSAFFLVLLEVVWCSFPFVMVTVYAGIRAVPGEVLEAASLDGASQWRIWRSVLAPMLRPILVVVTIQSVIWDFKVFTQIYVMTNGGGIAGQNLVLNVYAYQQAFASSQYGLGSAIGVVTLLILLAVTLVYLRLLRRQGEEL